MPVTRSVNGSRAGSSGGGGSSQPIPSVGAVTANSISISWTDPNSDPKFDIFLVQGGVATYVGETTSTSFVISSGISSSTTYSVRVLGVHGGFEVSVTTPASALLPNSPYLFLGQNANYTSSGANDGTPWYWPLVSGSPQPGTFNDQVLNLESQTISTARALIASFSATPNPIQKF